MSALEKTPGFDKPVAMVRCDGDTATMLVTLKGAVWIMRDHEECWCEMPPAPRTERDMELALEHEETGG